MKWFAVWVAFLIAVHVSGQNSFKARLLFRNDSTPVSYAAIRLSGTETYAETNFEGKFELVVPGGMKVLQLEVFAIGLRDTVACLATAQGQLLFIDRPSLPLGVVNIEGYTARGIVEKAVAMIPVNYTDSSFAAFTFVRRYMKVNNKFRNLIEARMVVLYLLKTRKNNQTPEYGFCVQNIRRSPFSYVIDDFKYGRDILYFLTQDPVYNVSLSALNPNAFDYYNFSFDSTSNDSVYVIRYSCSDFSSESHGLENFLELGMEGEGTEKGCLVIDAETFAFKRIERISERNPNYHYPKNNNCLLPSRKYFVEFVQGTLVSEYKERNGKWFLTFQGHQHTNDYFDMFTGKKIYSISDVTEWHCDSVTHFIPTSMAGKFVSDTSLTAEEYSYNPSQWTFADSICYYFYTANEVFNSLGAGILPEQIFSEGGKRLQK